MAYWSPLGMLAVQWGRGMVPALWNDQAGLADILLNKRTKLCRNEIQMMGHNEESGRER